MLDPQELPNYLHCNKQRTYHFLIAKSQKIATLAFLIWLNSPRKVLFLVIYACVVILYWTVFSSAPAARCFVFTVFWLQFALHQLLTLNDQQAAVHLDCYQSLKYPTGPWKCERCQEMPLDSVLSGNQSDCNGVKACLVQCGLCHGTSGAFRRATKGQWVHAFCAEVMICVFPHISIFLSLFIF